MERLNYHHLLYFWTVARAGTIAKASAELQLSQPTISEQLRLLESSFGEDLFEKAGRNLVLTEAGRAVYAYAERIFALGKELAEVMDGRATLAQSGRFRVGVASALPALLARRLLQPATGEGVSISCHAGALDALLARLAVRELDLVLADCPLPPAVRVRAYSHLLGESGTSFFAAPSLAAKCKGKFPSAIDGMPFLLPSPGSSLRHSLEAWFDASHVRPAIAGEFDDSAILMEFGREGAGIFAAPTAIEKDMARSLGVKVVGRTDAVVERYYAIGTERKVSNPVVSAIRDNAQQRIFK
jgi:LysR family transcriptional activator of nhaA